VLRRLRSSSLAVQLALLSVGVTVLAIGVSFVALRARTQSEVRRVFADELAGSQRGLRQIQDRNLRLLLATSSLVSTSPTLRAAIQTWLGESNAGLPARPELLATIQREVERIFQDLDRDLIVVTDNTGKVLAAAGHGAPKAADDLGRFPAVHFALNTDTIIPDSGFGVLQVDGTPMQVGCVPIVLQGYAIGALVLGERLDRLMAQLDSAMGTRSVVTAGNAVMMSNLAAAPVGAAWHPLPDGLGAEAVRRLRIQGEDYVAATLPLGRTEDGRAARLELVRSLSEPLRPISRSLGWSFLVAGLLALVLGGAGAVLVSRGTLRPLARFVGFMRQGADTGALERFADPGAPAEIATMTDAYNHLIDTLSREHAELEQRSVELAMTNAVLQAQVREREKAEQALAESEEQLRQSQKLEALGTLAGGVAHDFNNLLSVIMGYAHLTSSEVPADSPLRADLAEIGQAATRASGLVKQLLAFSRKQVLQPRIVDLNNVVGGMEKMLRRLIGEDIQLHARLAPDIARIRADPGQLEQVVMNLVVNGRDAMPKGGTLTIETASVMLDEKYEHRPEAIAAGPAVMLVVSDSGIGMDAATRRRIFEPFFTTKEPGKGTGLGLSTVYGIVRQSGGSITVYSEPGEGCTFRVYFPPVGAAEKTGEVPVFTTDLLAGHETVLLVEDEAQVRSLVRRCLTSKGYAVLDASHGKEALEVADEHRGTIQLLLTDVVMPHMSGKELAERMRAQRPDIRVLFFSGHSDEAIERHGVLTPESAFLQKPVDPDVLLRTVRDVLDAEPAPSRGT
jgi:signal transduction histidine kinase/ActR/RegA family two-component response regulator